MLFLMTFKWSVSWAYHWLVESDSLGFNISVKNSAATRRNMLSIISSIYDPLEPLVLHVNSEGRVHCSLLLGNGVDCSRYCCQVVQDA